MTSALEAFTALMLLIASAGAMFLCMEWIDQELRAAPDNRTLAARALIGAWYAIRSGVEWVFNKIGLTTRT